MHATLPLLTATDFPTIGRTRLETLQVNLGYLCNQTCLHCHVNAGPRRTETMSLETIDEVLELLASCGASRLDLTGGAPELNGGFRYLVTQARGMGASIIDRCNLTVLLEPGQEDLAEFLAASRVEIIASLPCYLEDNVDAQRGEGVFRKSIDGLRLLNDLGYGREPHGLPLSLVFNPQGAALPPPQEPLEAQYRQHLKTHYGVEFTRLYTLANMPIQRFGSRLVSKGKFQEYMNLLRSAHREANVDAVMCRTLISIDWRGYVYDCDFNQMLGLHMRSPGERRTHVSDLRGVSLEGETICVADHCYGCTAGQGSSCGGALT